MTLTDNIPFLVVSESMRILPYLWLTILHIKPRNVKGYGVVNRIYIFHERPWTERQASAELGGISGLPLEASADLQDLHVRFGRKSAVLRGDRELLKQSTEPRLLNRHFGDS